MPLKFGEGTHLLNAVAHTREVQYSFVRRYVHCRQCRESTRKSKLDFAVSDRKKEGEEPSQRKWVLLGVR